MVDTLTINFYQTPFMRGQIDVSSNVARHLSRLYPFPLQHPPFIPRRSFRLTIQADFDTTDAALFNYASIFFPAELLGSGTIGHEDGETLYYFVELDPDDVNNTVNARSLTFTLDEWATATASGDARQDGTALLSVDGILQQGHAGSSSSIRLEAPEQPTDQLPQNAQRVEVVTGGDVVILAICTESRSLQGGSADKVQKTRVFARCYTSYPSQAWDYVAKTPYGTAAVDLSVDAADLLSNLNTDYYTLTATAYQSQADPYTFGALTVDKLVAVPADLLPSTAEEYPFIGIVEKKHGDDPAVPALLWIGTPPGEAYAHYGRKSYVIPQSSTQVHTLGNIAQKLVFPPSNGSYLANASLSIVPSAGAVSVFIGDGLNDVEITESLTIPFSAIADAAAREIQGVRDVLSAVSVGASLIGGIVTKSPATITSGLTGAVGLASDLMTRTYAATRQNVGSALRNITANSDSPETCAGAVRVERYTPANSDTIRHKLTLYGWVGDRGVGAVVVPYSYAFYRFADDVALTISGKLATFPWLAEAVRDLLVRGVRVWNDEDTTRYKDFTAAASVEEVLT